MRGSILMEITGKKSRICYSKTSACLVCTSCSLLPRTNSISFSLSFFLVHQKWPARLHHRSLISSANTQSKVCTTSVTVFYSLSGLWEDGEAGVRRFVNPDWRAGRNLLPTARHGQGHSEQDDWRPLPVPGRRCVSFQRSCWASNYEVIVGYPSSSNTFHNIRQPWVTWQPCDRFTDCLTIGSNFLIKFWGAQSNDCMEHTQHRPPKMHLKKHGRWMYSNGMDLSWISDDEIK